MRFKRICQEEAALIGSEADDQTLDQDMLEISEISSDADGAENDFNIASESFVESHAVLGCGGEISSPAQELLNINMESIHNRLGLKPSKLRVSKEDFKTKAALIFKSMIDMAKKIWIKISGFLTDLFKSFNTILKKLENLKVLVDKLDKDIGDKKLDNEKIAMMFRSNDKTYVEATHIFDVIRNHANLTDSGTKLLTEVAGTINTLKEFNKASKSNDYQVYFQLAKNADTRFNNTLTHLGTVFAKSNGEQSSSFTGAVGNLVEARSLKIDVETEEIKIPSGSDSSMEFAGRVIKSTLEENQATEIESKILEVAKADELKKIINQAIVLSQHSVGFDKIQKQYSSIMNEFRIADTTKSADSAKQGLSGQTEKTDSQQIAALEKYFFHVSKFNLQIMNFLMSKVPGLNYKVLKAVIEYTEGCLKSYGLNSQPESDQVK
jgi:hypothetical protein